MKHYTIFFEAGVMKAFEAKPRSFNQKTQARLSAFPVAEEFKGKVNFLLWQSIQEVLRYSLIPNGWQPDESKEYQIEAEFIVDDSKCYAQNGICTCNNHCPKVLVLINN